METAPIKIKGISFNLKTGKWTSSVTVNKKKVHLGYFKHWINAVLAKTKGENEYHLPNDPIALQIGEDFKRGQANN